MIWQLLLSQQRWWDLLSCSEVWPGSCLLVLAADVLHVCSFACPPGQGDERIERAQEAVISFGITVSPNTYGPETGGRATVRLGGFGLLIVRALGKG